MPLVDEMPQLVSMGRPLDMANVGVLRESNDVLDDPAGLRGRMEEDGYLLLRGVLDRDAVLAARAEVVRRLAANGFLMPGTEPDDVIANPERKSYFMPELLAKDNAQLERVLYSGEMIELFGRLLGGPVSHYDFTWFRSVWPGQGTASHCDVVYMGRGERERLYTAWTPMGDIDYAQGGLMVLEGSHQHERLRATYCQRDVDTYCTNRGQTVPEGLGLSKDTDKAWGERFSGWLGGNPNQIRRAVGGRWLTGEYRAGDVLVFSMYLVHGSTDNTSERIRLSSDSRYQPAGTVMDERWVGANPVGHGKAGKLGRIC